MNICRWQHAVKGSRDRPRCTAYSFDMDIKGLIFLPLRVTVAATEATLAFGQLASPNGPILREGGYAKRISLLLGEGGLLDQIAKVMADERGPVGLANTFADITSEDRPIGKALARDGLIDRMAAEDGPLYRFLAPGGALDRLLAEEGALDRILAPGGLLDQLLAEEGILEKLLEPGGTLDQLIALGGVFESIVPKLESLGSAIPGLNQAVGALNMAVEPLSALAGRLPGSRRKIIPTASEEPAYLG